MYVTNRSQIEDTDRVTSYITEASLRPLLSLLNIDYVSHIQRRSEFGVINPIFFINGKKEDEPIELVLRVKNPHPYWSHRKTLNEIRITSWLKKRTAIPLPEIISWHTDIPGCLEPNLLSCEYSMALKVKGIELERLLRDPEISQEEKKEWGRRVLQHVKSLHTPELYKELSSAHSKFGMFTSLPVTPITTPQASFVECMDPGPCQYDGPPLGPFSSFQEYLISVLDWGISMFDVVPHLTPFAPDFLPSLRFFRNEFLPSYFSENSDAFAEDIELQICHCDLNPGNIMVDPEAGEVSAILDWDGCGLLPMDFEWPSICGLTEACFGEGEEEAEALLKELGFVKPVGFEVRKKLLEVILKVRYMLFWCSTWWTSKPGQRETLDLDYVELLPVVVSRHEGQCLKALLEELGCWKPASEDQAYLEEEEDFKKIFGKLMEIEESFQSN